jgi:branched-chain amino acid transport system permease protein
MMTTDRPAHSRVLSYGRWRPLETVFWLAAAACFFIFPDRLTLASQILIIGLFAFSLDLLMGYAGIATLGHAAFFGIGAYTAGLLARYGLGEPIFGLVAAGAVAALVGLLSSTLVVRGSDLSRLMVTLGLGVLLYELANKAISITGGVDGLQDMQVLPIAGLFSFDLGGKTGFVYAYVVAFVMFLLGRRLIYSPFGLALRAIHDNPRRTPAIGIDNTRSLSALYAFACALAGIAGALLAQTTGFVALDVVSFSRSADVLIIVILGGTARLYGGFVGAALFMIAREVLSNINPVYWQFWLGIILILAVLFARGGVMGSAALLMQRFRARMARRGNRHAKLKTETTDA